MRLFARKFRFFVIFTVKNIDFFTIWIIILYYNVLRLLGGQSVINEKMKGLGSRRSVIRELFEYGKKRKAELGEERVFDFSLGNPSVPAPRAVSDSILSVIDKKSPLLLHGYTSAQGDLSVRQAIAEHIKKRDGYELSPDMIYMTAGAAAALTSALGAVVNEGEEVLLLAPYFPEYKVFAERAGAAVRVALPDGDLLPSIQNIREMINEKTAAIIVNSPNNPTGAVYPEESIAALSALLSECEEKYSHPIYLIADEPYRELVYDGAFVPFIPKYYHNTVVCYSFSKSLSLPGERIGYVAVCTEDAREVYAAVCGAARALGYVCAPSLFQNVIKDCLGLTADISVYDENRRSLTETLSSLGFDVSPAAGAFYLFVRSPSGDAAEFSERAKGEEVLIVPSDDFGIPGYARISYCVSPETVKASLPAFKRIADSYKKDSAADR